jgi:hypothetical protein
MNDGQYQNAANQTNGMPSLLVSLMAIKDTDMGWIIPHPLRKFEGDTVLAYVARSLVVVPFDYHVSFCIDIIVHTKSSEEGQPNLLLSNKPLFDGSVQAYRFSGPYFTIETRFCVTKGVPESVQERFIP